MKKPFLILGFILFFVATHAQGIETNKTNNVTGHKQMETGWEPLLVLESNSLYLRFIRGESLPEMQLRWIRPKDSIFITKGEQKLIIRLVSGELISFTNRNYAASSSGGGSVNAQETTLGLRITLQSEDIEKIGDSLIEKIRIYTKKSYFEFDLDTEKASLIQNSYRLFRQTGKK